MRPHRVRLTHSLVDNYQLGDRMILQRPQKRSEHQISQFHADGASKQRSEAPARDLQRPPLWFARSSLAAKAKAVQQSPAYDVSFCFAVTGRRHCEAETSCAWDMLLETCFICASTQLAA